MLWSGVAFGQAGGLYLPENGGPASGAAMAGQAALARDAQTAWLNPAGMTRLDESEVLVSLMPFNLDMTFDPSSTTTAPGSDGGQQGGWLAGGALYLAAPVHERVALGFSITSPGGLAIDPSDTWVARSYMTEATLIALNFQPSIGFKINDQWSVGAGLDIQYLTFEQRIGLPGPGGMTAELDGDNWELGFSASVLWEPVEGTRLGARYRSAMDHDLDGDLTLIGMTSISTGMLMPQSVTVSYYQDIGDSFALLVDAGWTDWSEFDRTVIETAGPTLELARDWQDTWNVGVGAHYRPADRWLLMAGAAYVSSAVSDSNRTPDLPVDEQWRLSAGVEYEARENVTVGATFTYVNLGSNDIDQTRGPFRIAGSYDAHLYLLGLYAAFRF